MAAPAPRISMGSADGCQGGRGAPLSAWLGVQRVPQAAAAGGLCAWPEEGRVPRQHGSVGGSQRPPQPPQGRPHLSGLCRCWSRLLERSPSGTDVGALFLPLSPGLRAPAPHTQFSVNETRGVVRKRGVTWTDCFQSIWCETRYTRVR
ncbi:hypothetical protein HJG60_011624 [Phyllostomus discolor]|uniref:Uncharacterized protein n=1 Tax=Phyllostomus discolor TaxID=89673 RepID=A0A833ZU04_9CHIR|nr:hypothetical protein HJG60_011624 [Phyllostomus discolor]